MTAKNVSIDQHFAMSEYFIIKMEFLHKNVYAFDFALTIKDVWKQND